MAWLFAGSASAAANLPSVGAATRLVIDPTNQSTIYAVFEPTASESDIYKSTDWGVTWTFLQAFASVADLEVDPQNHSTLYTSSQLPEAVAIYKSTDGGLTWNEADSGISAINATSSAKDEIYLLAIDPVNEGVIYAAGKITGLYKSIDGGQDWTSIDGGIDTLTSEIYEPYDLRVDPSQSSTLYFGMDAVPPGHGRPFPPVTVPSGLYKSTDGGTTWNPGVGFVGASVDPANFRHLVVCVNGTFRSSTDGGTTWATRGDCPSAPIAVVISDTNPNQIFIASLATPTVWGSNDGGETFKSLYTFPIEVMSLASRSGNVYVGAYNSGLYISRDDGATWSVSSSATVPQTINVPTDQSTIQAAIDAANSGDTVIVAPGTYYEQLDFKGKAITVKSSDGATTTILDGNNSGPILWFHNNEGNGSVLQGFTLTHTSSDNTSGGSAVELTEASPTIEDNVFVANYDGRGFGLGSAISSYISSAAILRNYFANNTGLNTIPDQLSAVISLSGGSPVVADNVFANNSSVASYIQATLGDPQIYNNTMVGNFVGLDLIILTPTLPTTMTIASNNLIAFNQVGLYTFAGSDGLLPTLDNNLVYGNTTVNYQNVADQTGTNGNISVNPQLKDWANGDVHLLYGSPAIDVGDSTVIQASASDFYGNTRVFAGMPGNSALVDIGAVEYQPPVVAAAAGSLEVIPDTAKTGALGAAGADSTEPLTYAIVTPPVHGTLTLTDATTGAIQYVPAQGYLGTDSFTFTVRDPYGTVSEAATEQVTISDIAPTVNGLSLITKPDTAVAGRLTASLAYPGQTLTYSLVSSPTHGTVSFNAGNGQFRYVPKTGYSGSDSFTFQAVDAYGNPSNIATVSVTVNDLAPKVTASKLRASPGRSTSGTLSATKAYTGQTLTFSVVSPPGHGTVNITNPKTGAYTYTPASRFSGSDSFTFQVVDQWGTVSNTAAVKITML